LLFVLAMMVCCLALVSTSYGQDAGGGGGGGAGPAFLLTPNGNPTGPASANSPQQPSGSPFDFYTVNLSPGLANTAQAWPIGVTLSDVLGAQGFNQANGWTVDIITLQGTMTLNRYLAYTEVAPVYQSPSGKLNVDQMNAAGLGGAEFGLTYNPQGADPSGASVHWLQVIGTNKPGFMGGTVQDGAGVTWYVDDNNPANPLASGPWFDVAFPTANPTDFFDNPNRMYADSTSWLGMVFIGTWDQGNKVINISDQAVV
jgi:hypothetical protein